MAKQANLLTPKEEELMKMEKALTAQEEAIKNTAALLQAQKEERKRLGEKLRENVRNLPQENLSLK